MNEEKNRNQPDGKKPYRKPEVKRVPLRPEEATLGNCKTTGVAGPADTDCTTLSCTTDGS